ncbi:hypothetical protein [Burkholderia sp. BCC0322]|uniref:hypothetical protein n=1 Tax=unclassified Burkholderia TaxID=2613784 RepID=UPI00158CC512|nr:hypothetical protein [Burkholderia sp. BCC0322]
MLQFFGIVLQIGKTTNDALRLVWQFEQARRVKSVARWQAGIEKDGAFGNARPRIATDVQKEIEKPPGDFFNWPSARSGGKQIRRFDEIACGEALAATVDKK